MSKNNQINSPENKKPPLGIIPKKFHEENTKIKRFNDICGAITRYYNGGFKINIEWIIEYNELIDFFNNHSS